MMASRRITVLVLGSVLAAAAIACTKDIEKPNGFAEVTTGKAPNPGGSTEGGFPDSSAADSGRDGGACNELVPLGSGVDKIALAADPPASTGGTVIDGTYDLKEYSVYVGISGVVTPLGISARMTLRIDGTAKTIDKVSEITSGGDPPTTALTSSTFSTMGSAFATTDRCPVAAGKSWQFTSNSLNQIVLTDPATREALTFLKRP